MNQFKRAQVILLSTKNESIFHLFTGNKSGLYLYPEKQSVIPRNPYCINQHLYIISDDEIKEGDWYYDYGCHLINISSIRQYKGQMLSDKDKKIIATTDDSLHPQVWSDYSREKGIHGLPKPSQQFIEKYIEEYNKGNVIKDVLIEYENIMCPKEPKCINCYSKCLIGFKLKINPKDNTITIKKLKESWNREEVENLLYKITEDFSSSSRLTAYFRSKTDNWIKENL